MAVQAETARRAVAPESAEPGARIFVWGVWTALLVLELGGIARFGPDVPIGDDFDVVGVLSGAQPATLEWLWSQHNEHRVPLPRLILLGLYRLSGNDFRAGMFFNVGILAALAGASMIVAERRRGAARAFDAVFPLLLLGPGHYVNLLWSWQVQFVLSTALAGAVVLRVVARPAWPGPAAVAVPGAALAALPLCGANGLVLVPGLTLWLLVAARAHARSGRSQGGRAALLVLTAALPALMLGGLYLAGYHRAEHHPPPADISAALRTSLQFLSLIFGPAGRTFWPVSGIVALLLVASSMLLVLRAALAGPPQERPRAWGLVCVFAAFGTLVLSLGWGRAGSGANMGFERRFVTLIAPLNIALVFAWDLYGTPALRRIVLTLIFDAALVLLWPNAQEALVHAQQQAGQVRAFERALRDGEPLYVLIKRFPFLHPSQDVLTRELRALHAAGIGVFAALHDDGDGALRAVAVPVVPADVRLARWEGNTAHVTGVDPYIHFVLPEAVPVAGIRIAYSHANPIGGPARFVFLWSADGSSRRATAQRYANWALPTGRDRLTTIWVAGTVKEFWIQPDNQPCEFTIERLELLVPKG